MSHNWKNILVSPTQSIQDVLVIIDQEALKLAMVVDDQGKLLGTVTDGDIRRGLINNKSLDEAIAEVMFTSPSVATAGTPREVLVELMESKGLLSMPILDSQGMVIGLELLNDPPTKKHYLNPVFLMAGGFGTRLRPLTDNCPKPLLKVGDRPILEIVMQRFIKAGFRNFYISTHYLPEMIREYFGNGDKWGVSVTYIHESEPLGTGGALGLLPPDLPDLPVIVTNGDILTKVDFGNLLAFHNKNQALATMCVREYEYQVPFGVVESDNNRIKSLVEKPIQRFHVNAGIYVIGQEIIQAVRANECIDMPSLFEKHIQSNVLIYPFHEYWLDIGRMDDFNRAQTDIKTLGL